jgi:ribosomal protein S18 acetylase RimI-like enzyme
MQSSPSIRFAEPTDAEAISSLIGRVWSKHFAYSVTPDDLEDFLSTKLHPSQIALEIANPDNHFITALSDSSSIIGVVQLVRNTTEPGLSTLKHVEIRRLYVDDEYQGKGLARALMGKADGWARAEGYEGIWLGVWEKNERAFAFYGKMGYVTKGEHMFYVGSSERRDWVMEKVL